MGAVLGYLMPSLLDIPDSDIVDMPDGRLGITRLTMEAGGWSRGWKEWVMALEQVPGCDIWLLPDHWKRPVRRVERVDGFPVESAPDLKWWSE